MKIAGIGKGSVVDGPGYNYVIFVQGCSHHCKECHNPSTWDFGGGYEVDVEDLHHEIINNFYTGVTLSGGDPMDAILRMNKSEYLRFITFLKDLRQVGLNIICYTGYYYEDLLNNPRQKELLSNVDLLIDGPFEIANKKEIPFRGSTNQNLVPITERGRNMVKHI